jgi:neutral ceramidase
MKRLIFLTALAFGLNILESEVVAQEQARTFRAGAAAANITPPLGTSINGNMHDKKAAHIHDELHVRCLVLDDGATKLTFAVVDSCMVPREIIDEAKKIATEATGIPAANMLVSATHTHEAPASASVFQSDADPAYTRFLVTRIADGIRLANNNLAPAKIGWSSAQLPEEVFNRRWHMKPGTVPPDPFGNTTDQVKMNPAPGDPNLTEPAGPTDPQISFIAVKDLTGRPISLLANYSLHYVGGEGAAHVSADYFGMFADRIQELLGADRLDPPFVGIMTNGTSADCNNIDFRKPPVPRKPYEQMRHVANRAADKVFEAYPKIEWKEWTKLASAQRELQLGVRLPSGADIDRAKKIRADAGEGPLRTLDQIYARETVLLAKYPEKVPVLLQALRIGDLGIAAIPCEVFVEIGLEIKSKSILQPAFTIELANGYNGYLPMRKHHELGGYETWRARSSYLEIGAADAVTETILALFHLLSEEKGS